MDTERYSDAVSVYRDALRYRPDDPALLFNLGIALEHSASFREALLSYELGIENAPDFADAHFNAARIPERAWRRGEAIRHFNASRNLQKAHNRGMDFATRLLKQQRGGRNGRPTQARR